MSAVAFVVADEEAGPRTGGRLAEAEVVASEAGTPSSAPPPEPLPAIPATAPADELEVDICSWEECICLNLGGGADEADDDPDLRVPPTFS
jgi:hypothetical protein